MLTLEAIAARRDLIDSSPDLLALRDHLIATARPVIATMPPVPAVKALLSRDGGVCPDDGTPLDFDPWSPDSHRCPTCQRSFSGSRHHAHWARAQHLWLAERAAHLATLHVLTDDAAAGARARDLLAVYFDLYFDLPNRDNVLGPSHLFFSTYLESIWILDYLAAAFLLREAGALDEDELGRIDAIAEEAATIIAEFNEGMSNRQTWNSAALTAIATWFGDEDLAVSAIEGRTGLLGHLADGFGSDGMWFEGENYHLFALRGLLVGLEWATTAGAELLGDRAVSAHLGQALMAPAATALPDFTFPARKDARYGVSLAHPAYLENWEAGLALLDAAAPLTLVPWLRALYGVAPQRELTYDAWLHDAGWPLPSGRSRTRLSWWALLTMRPELPEVAEPWTGATRFMEQQQLAVIRHGSTYVSVECGTSGGGHGHPDRLHLTLHAGGVHWLPDPGAGSYTTADLFWYRSTLAHNAPRLDERDQLPDDEARCVAFDADGEWAWVRARSGDVERTVLSGPSWLLDVVQVDAAATRVLEVPWHVMGDGELTGESTWETATLASSFVDHAEKLVTAAPLAARLHATAGGATIDLRFAGDGNLLRATGPGLPGRRDRRRFYLRRTEANAATMVTLVDLAGTVTGLDAAPGTFRVQDGGGDTIVELHGEEATVVAGSRRITLAGQRPVPLAAVSFVRDAPMITSGDAVWVAAPPTLDGTLAGFDVSTPLELSDEHQYFRSETPYAGAEEFSAIAYVNWTDDDLYLAVEVTKAQLVIRPDDAAPLALDNEPDDLNADGIQLHWRDVEGRVHGVLVRPAANGELRTRAIGGASTPVHGRWSPLDGGYRITVALHAPGLAVLRRGEQLAFDLIVNEMTPGRIRRAGQLVWSGGPGWVYLRGDRHDPAAFGALRLIG